MTAAPMGARKLESPCRPMVIGIMPATIAMVVIMIGRTRLLQASRMAS